MSIARLRRTFLFFFAFLLTAAVFTACGDKAVSDGDSGKETSKRSLKDDDSDEDAGRPRKNTIDYSKEAGGEDLRKGKAAYEIGKFDEAAMSFSLAAQDGNAEAMYWLGKCFLDGTGPARDVEKAVSYFGKAEKAGYFIDPQTQFEVGECLFNGEGAAVTEAAKWYSKAAEQGHPEASLKAKEIQAEEAREAEAKRLAAESMKRFESIGIIPLSGDVELKMVKVEAGSFVMSAKDGEDFTDDMPHEVTLKYDFCIGRTEVTQAQWKAVMGSNPSQYKGDDLPVECVTWYKAMEFCEKLNEMGKAPKGWKFSLPTETQWEYAARGGRKSKGYKYSGSDTLDDVAWHEGNFDYKVHPVGQKKANELGLYDMSGNMEEWCLDDYIKDSRKQKAEFSRGNDSTGSDRVVRGGSGGHFAIACRVASRNYYSPGSRHEGLGFRVALVPERY